MYSIKALLTHFSFISTKSQTMSQFTHCSGLVISISSEAERTTPSKTEFTIDSHYPAWTTHGIPLLGTHHGVGITHRTKPCELVMQIYALRNGKPFPASWTQLIDDSIHATALRILNSFRYFRVKMYQNLKIMKVYYSSRMPSQLVAVAKLPKATLNFYKRYKTTLSTKKTQTRAAHVK